MGILDTHGSPRNLLGEILERDTLVIAAPNAPFSFRIHCCECCVSKSERVKVTGIEHQGQVLHSFAPCKN